MSKRTQAGSTRKKRPETGTPSRADKPDAGSMAQRMAAWGRNLDELRARAQQTGDARLDQLSRELENRYQAVRAEFGALATKAMDNAEKTSREASQSLNATAETAKAGTKRTWTDTKAASAELGSGFRRAWDELRNAVNRASNEFDPGRS